MTFVTFICHLSLIFVAILAIKVNKRRTNLTFVAITPFGNLPQPPLENRYPCSPTLKRYICHLCDILKLCKSILRSPSHHNPHQCCRFCPQRSPPGSQRSNMLLNCSLDHLGEISENNLIYNLNLGIQSEFRKKI